MWDAKQIEFAAKSQMLVKQVSQSPREPHERLQLARLRAGYDSASDAARAMGVSVPTYSHHENATRGFTRQAERYARFFRVSLDWLLTGRGEMRGRAAGVPLWGTVGAGAAVLPVSDDGGVLPLEHIDMPDAAHLAALRVQGDSQYPRFLDGEVILFETIARTPSYLVGRYCVCDLEDGRRLVKMLRRGTEKGLFTLESHNAPPEEDVKLRSAFAVRATLM